MGAPKGNEYYLIREKDGRDKTYTPDALLLIANEYFNWCLNNPLIQAVVQKRKINRDEEIIELVDCPKMRAFSLQGFCNFANICLNTFKNYEGDDDFLTVTTRIRGIIEGQQFEGAASGFLNPNIIARKLGLADQKEIKGNISVQQITGMEIK